MDRAMDRAPVWLLDFDGGPRPYAEVWALQRELVRARQAGAIPDTLILVEHDPVVTMGRSARQDHLRAPREMLAARGIELFEVERGGSATYHGPGQLVGYPIIDLARMGEDVGRYMRTLEATIIESLAAFGIDADRRAGYPGVWVGDAKICAMGVAVKRRVTMHGFALNVSIDLAGFDVINPCGLGLPVTSMAAILGRRLAVSDVRGVCAARFEACFAVDLVPVDAATARARAAGALLDAGALVDAPASARGAAGAREAPSPAR
jgi:lipoate-protein ligase B